MKTILATLIAFSLTPAWAEDDTFLPSAQPIAQPAAKPGGSRPEVLDFEGDVIEGQKKAPELFLQLDVEKADLSSVLYDRRDFNDFHAVDSKRRPKFSDPKMVTK
jgi:hypothetical protein